MRIVFQAAIDPFSSYSLHLFALVRELRKSGFEPVIRPIFHTGEIPGDVRLRLVTGLQPAPLEILLAPLCGYAPTPRKKTIRLFSWESTQIPASEVALLNQCACCVVPSNFVATVASACGVSVPIIVVPLGVSEEFWCRTIPDRSDRFVFACAGNPASGPNRKGLDRIVDLFIKAFGEGREDVFLVTKNHGDFLPESEIADWLAKCHCFINFATGGWELWAHQAMACGRPVIGCAYGGMADYFNAQNGFVVAHHLVPAKDGWTGLWAAMRYAFKYPHICGTVGISAGASVSHLTWENSCKRLAKVIEHVKSPPAISIESESILDRPFRFIHGLGDCCNAATLFKAVMARTGKAIEVCCDPDKSAIFEAAGCTIVKSSVRNHPWDHPDYNQSPEVPWSDNKTAFNCPWPMDAEFWKELCETKLRVGGDSESEQWAIKRAPITGKLVMLHVHGETSGHLKNMTIEMFRSLAARIEKLFGYVFLITESSCPSIEQLYTLICRARLVIGIDSGPLHLARLTDTPALGVWFGLHPTAFAIPCPSIRHLCFANHPFKNEYGSSAHYAKAGPIRAKEFNLRLVQEMTVDVIVQQVKEMLAG